MTSTLILNHSNLPFTNKFDSIEFNTLFFQNKKAVGYNLPFNFKPYGARPPKGLM